MIDEGKSLMKDDVVSIKEKRKEIDKAIEREIRSQDWYIKQEILFKRKIEYLMIISVLNLLMILFIQFFANP